MHFYLLFVHRSVCVFSCMCISRLEYMKTNEITKNLGCVTFNIIAIYILINVFIIQTKFPVDRNLVVEWIHFIA